MMLIKFVLAQDLVDTLTELESAGAEIKFILPSRLKAIDLHHTTVSEYRILYKAAFVIVD